jgi:beta-hydroxylase
MFLDPNEFSFTALLESRWWEIRREFDQLAQEQLVSWPDRGLYNHGWDVFGLWVMGQQLTDNCRCCPRTAEIVSNVPRMTTAGFSCLAPSTHIRPHVGYSDAVLRCHLGVVIPDGCAIQVGEESRCWEEGKCLVFDDTTLHSAWNESNTNRVVLLIDFARTGREFQLDVPPEATRLIQAVECQRLPPNNI